MLLQAGLAFSERDFFSNPFKRNELSDLLKGKDVSYYFSWRSPSFKKLGLDKDTLSDEDLIELMLTEPRLIKRPLICANDHVVVGSDKSALADFIQSK